MRNASSCRQRIPFLFAALTFSSLLAPPAEAQESLIDTVVREKIDVEVVNIDVLVTDKKGRPVRGLQRDDFELRVDGEEVPISNFYALEETPTPADATEAGTAEAAPAASENKLFVVAYLDNLRLRPSGREAALGGLRELFEEQLAAGAEVLLLANEKDALLSQTVIRERAEIPAALADMAEREAHGGELGVAREETWRRLRVQMTSCAAIERPVCSECFEELLRIVDGYARGAESYRASSLGALDAVVSALGALPGRKMFFFVTEDLPMRAGEEFYDYLVGRCPSQAVRVIEYQDEGLAELESLISRANANRITFYSLDPRGARTGAANSRQALAALANQTGGRAIVNTTNLTPDLERVARHFESRYSLGYSPAHAADGAVHKIEVRVPQQRVELRYQRNFLHKVADQSLAEKTIGALVLDAETNDLGLDMRTGNARRAGELYRVPFEVAVPLERLGLLPTDSGREGRLTLLIGMPEPESGRLSLRQLEVPVSLDTTAAGDEAAKADEYFNFAFQLDFPAGEHALSFGFQDDVGGASSFIRMKLGIAAPAAPAGR